MTPIERILTEGDITWRLDRGWRIVAGEEIPGLADGTWWWRYPLARAKDDPDVLEDYPTMALTEAEARAWETSRTRTTATQGEPVNWTRSSLCKTDHVTGNCLEAAIDPAGMVRLRDSRNPGTVLVVDPGDWYAFCAGVAVGDFADLPTLEDA